jgi:hypothetical protein
LKDFNGTDLLSKAGRPEGVTGGAGARVGVGAGAGGSSGKINVLIFYLDVSFIRLSLRVQLQCHLKFCLVFGGINNF